MSQQNKALMQMLASLADPAFFYENNAVSCCNAAAAPLCLNPGDCIEDLPLPQGAEAIHLVRSFGGKLWEMTLHNVDGRCLAQLRPCVDEDESLDLLVTAARGMEAPLSSMMAAGSTLFPRLEELEDESIQEQAGAISRGCFRLLRCLTAMTQFSRLQKEGETLYLEKTAVKSFFDELAEKWADALGDSEIPLEYHSPKNPFNGNLDRALAQRAVLCLLSNAASYRENGTPVVLHVSYMGSFVKIQVKNQGPALPPHLLATAFSRYQQTDGLDARQGTGLSLPLARRIAQKHGGNILLQSGDYGTMVTMTLRLDLPETDKINTPFTDPHGGYDPALVELSGVLPNTTYDSRNIDL